MVGLKWNTGKLYYSTVELGYQHVLTSPLPVCLSDGGHARPCDHSDLIRCRKYVKSQKARGGCRHTSTHKTQALCTLRSTMRKQGSDRRTNPRREASGFLFISLSFYWLIIISILTIFQRMQDKFY